MLSLRTHCRQRTGVFICPFRPTSHTYVIRKSLVADQALPRSMGALKTEEVVAVLHQSPETHRNVNRVTNSQLITHEVRTTTANINTSFATESLPQHDEKWDSRVEREEEVDQLYVQTHRLHQEHLQIHGIQGSEWPLPEENFDQVYTGITSSPSRSFHSSLSPAIGHNEFPYSSDYDSWMDIRN